MQGKTVKKSKKNKLSNKIQTISHPTKVGKKVVVSFIGLFLSKHQTSVVPINRKEFTSVT